MKNIKSLRFGSSMLYLMLLVFTGVHARGDAIDPNTVICNNCNDSFSGTGPAYDGGAISASCWNGTSYDGTVSASGSWQGLIYNSWYEALLYGYPSGSGVGEEASAFDAYNGGEGYVEVYGDCGGSSSGWEDSSDNQNDVYVVGVGEYGSE